MIGILMAKCPHWKQIELASARDAKTFAELGTLAIRVLRKFPKKSHGKIIEVCGPVSTGGFNSVKVNFLVLAEAVRLLRERGDHVFDQTPLEEGVVSLWKNWKNIPGNAGYCWPILDEIYCPIFESGLIGTLFFLPGWESSVGSCWERSRGLALKMRVEPYPKELYQQILESHGLTHP